MKRLILIALTLLSAVTPALAQDGTAAAAGLTAEYYHVDAIGSVRVVTNQAGAVVRRHDYLPFGEEWQPQSGSNDARRFSGKERDAETGLDYFGARYYAASAGRFTTIDPVQTWQENLVDPQRWNRYAYVRNNPLRYTDPDGRCIDACVLEALAAAVAVKITADVVTYLTSPQGRDATRQIASDVSAMTTAVVKWGSGLFASEKQKQLPATAGPTGHISPSEVSGKTPPKSINERET
jgi:RHS repeat-associated protein